MLYTPTTYVRKKNPSSRLLTAIFGDGAVSFRLSDTATLGDIAERLSEFRTLHVGVPISIDVTFNPVSGERPQTRGREGSHR